MIVLVNNSDTLNISLGNAVTANQMQCFSSWRDITSTTYVAGRNAVYSNNTSYANIVSAPAASTQRVIDFMSVFNKDTASNTVNIVFNDGSTLYDLCSVILAPNERLEYAEGEGFTSYDATGAVKNSSSISGLQMVVLTSDVTNNNATANTIADITGMSFPVISGGTYYFKFIINYTSAITTTGSRWAISGPTFTSVNYSSRYTLTATTETVNYSLAYNMPAAANATSLTVGNTAIIEGIVKPSANGNVIGRFASKIANSAITAKAGSVLYWQKIQ
jgi:hypothetical protein